MFTIKDVDFQSEDYGVEPYLNNWPMLYILENGKKAYVGQTNSINKHMSQHKEADSKKIFTKAHFIYCDKFNQSATFDYESRLISLMAADAQFVLTNQNAGLSGIEYYDKLTYDQEFVELWKELQKKKLVKSTIEELEQSDLFKYSPYKTLSDEQRSIVAEIVDNLKKNLNRSIIVGGTPGSGKTILAVYLFKLLRESKDFKDLEIGFVVPPASLRKTMQMVFKGLNNLSSKDVLGPNDVAKKKYDILIVDESHRLKQRKNLSRYDTYDDACQKIGLPISSTQVDWILKQSRCSIFFFDKDQIVFPAGLNVAQIIQNDSFSTRMMAYYNLLSQMRCKGGVGYLGDVFSLLYDKLDHKVSDSNYEIRLVDDFSTFDELYRFKEKKEGLTRMVAGYAWDWKSKGDTTGTITDFEIEGHNLRWNSKLENWVHTDQAINEVGCIHSIQGYDLNYGFVILAEDIKFDETHNRIYVDKDSYKDKYGKIQASDDELERYVKNIYYVLLSRGIKGTYVYVCDKALRKHLENYINLFTANDLKSIKEI